MILNSCASRFSSVIRPLFMACLVAQMTILMAAVCQAGPIDPSYIPIASIEPDTLALMRADLVQAVCFLGGIMLAIVHASNWKG